MWAILNVTAPQDWRTLDADTRIRSCLWCPICPATWANADDPPLWLSRPDPNPWMFDRLMLFEEDMVALGLDIRSVKIPCSGQICNGDFKGFSLAHWDNLPRLIDQLSTFLAEVLGEA